MPRVIVIGGGISGLATAFYLKRWGAQVTLVEREPRLGGLLETREVDGCRIEAGPDSFLASKTSAIELIRDLGLESEVIASNDSVRRTYIVRDGGLVPMPEGLVLMAPTNIAALENSPLISAEGLAHARKEIARTPLPEAAPDRSIGDFVRDHYGQEFVDYLAEPLLTGVFGGDLNRLSLQAVLPRFADLETQYGSVTRGLSAERSHSSGPLFQSLRGGFQQLVDALQSALAGVERITGFVTAVEPGVRVQVNGDWLVADHAVIALRAWQAAPLIRAVAPGLAAALEEIPYSSAVTVGVTYPAEGFPHPLDGFGFLVPKIERRNIVACTWVNRKFDHRAPAGRVVLRAFLGGDDWAAQATDDQILTATLEDLKAFMGLDLRPTGVSIARWPKSMPQYEVGHAVRAAAIRSASTDLPNIHLTGNFFDGIGIPDSIRQAKSVCNTIERCYPPINHPATC